jgi:hypothetical protein
MNMRRRITALFLALAVPVTAVFAQSAADFQIEEEKGELTIVKYTGWDTEPVIPAAIRGKPVRTIASESFKDAGITALTLPAGLVTIGKGAFSNNKLYAMPPNWLTNLSK